MNDSNDGDAILEIQASLPPDGRRVWYFPGARDHGHADVIVRVYRRDGSSWIACLAYDDKSFDTHPDAFVMPCGQRIFLCNGVADRDDPMSWRALKTARPPRAIWSSDRGIVVFCDGISLDVFGPQGPLWHAVEIAEIFVEAVTCDEIVCTAYDASTGDNVEWRFDTQTGRRL